MAEIFIPTLHTFAMGNTFTGSSGQLRFRIVPQVVKKTAKEVDMEQSSICVEIWHGLFSYENSAVEDSKEFSMSEEGLNQLRQWLEDNI
jgi:hypothetical protein